MPDESSSGPVIVVGVDGSGSSNAALGWAGRQALLTGGVVWAVTVWEYPRFGPDVEAEAFARAAGSLLAAAVLALIHRPG